MGALPGSSCIGANERSVSVAAKRRTARESIISPRYGCSASRVGRRSPEGVAAQRPDLVDALGLVDPIEVEHGEREDLGGRPVGVLQDLLRVRGLAEEVTLALAGLEPGREAAGEAAQLPGAEACRAGREEENRIDPDRQHLGSV